MAGLGIPTTGLAPPPLLLLLLLLLLLTIALACKIHPLSSIAMRWTDQ